MHIKVSTEVLVRQSEAVSESISRMNRELEELSGLIDRTRGYWMGEAAETCRKKYLEEKESIAETVKHLQDHPINLLKMAGVYKQTEEAAKSISQALPSSALS